MRWQAVIFDLDDTLYPESTYVLSGFRSVAEYIEMHLSIPQEEVYGELQGFYQQGIRGDTFNRWLTHHGFSVETWIPRLIEQYRIHAPKIEPYPAIAELLVTLSMQCKLGLISDGYLEVQQRKLTALGLASYFDTIVFSDTWGREAWKPSPVPFQYVLDALGVPPENAVYIGDNPKKDFVGALGVGMKSIWWRRDEGEYMAVVPVSEQYAPDFLVTDLLSLKSVLFDVT